MNLKSLLLLPWPYYLLWGIAIPTLLTCIPPRPYRKYVSVMVLFCILIKAEFFYPVDKTRNDVSIALVLQGALFNLFFYTYNLFFLVEYPEFTDYRPNVETLEDVQKLQPFTWKKFKWSINRSILFTVTGSGWNWGIDDHNKSLSSKNWLKNFLINELLIKYTVYDIFYHFYMSTEYIKSGGWGVGHEQDLFLFHKNSNLSVPKQLLLAFGSCYCIYFGINVLYNITIFFHVFIFKSSKLDDFPVLFGSFNNEYTVKSLWGNFWHKLMYQFSVPQSKFLAGCDYKCQHLNTKPRYGLEVWRKYLMFLFVFIFTGIFHATGTLNLQWLNNVQYNINVPQFFQKFDNKIINRCFYSFIFFPFQFILIIIETVAIKFYRKTININLPKWLLLVIGFTWIGLSEIYLMQGYIDEMVKAGFDLRELVARTPIDYIFNYYQFQL